LSKTIRILGFTIGDEYRTTVSAINWEDAPLITNSELDWSPSVRRMVVTAGLVVSGVNSHEIF
jgi:hypothetical protein